jgi:hypothetical protein
MFKDGVRRYRNRKGTERFFKYIITITIKDEKLYKLYIF